MHPVCERDQRQVHLHLHHAPPQALLVRGLGPALALVRLALIINFIRLLSRINYA